MPQSLQLGDLDVLRGRVQRAKKRHLSQNVTVSAAVAEQLLQEHDELQVMRMKLADLQAQLMRYPMGSLGPTVRQLMDELGYPCPSQQ
jgi:hypothetical protein